MDIIKKIANKIIYYNIIDEDVSGLDSFKREVNNSLDEIVDKTNKIHLLNLLITSIDEVYKEHLKKCKSKDNCRYNDLYDYSLFFLQNELLRLDVIINENTFTKEDKNTAEHKLDLILKEIQFLKNGQELIYEDLLAEIEELKKLYFLGKKNWHQLLMGKVIEMTASEIIGETVAKNIVDIVKEQLPRLID